jgi:ribosomal protein S18 acetylase RimI-like enzyme
MERALEEARTRGLADVGLDVDADNVVARKLYEEMGFATARLRMHRRTRPTLRPPADTGE